MFTRRQMLLGGAAATVGGGLLLPRLSQAAVAPRDRKFIFVLAKGGWDCSKAFAPIFSSSVPHDAGDAPRTVGNLDTVSNPDRPVIDAWWDSNYQRVAKIDGMLIRSINHPVCRRLWLTNNTGGDRADWPTLIGAAAADRYSIPHIVIEGNSIGAEYAAYTCVTGTNGQMERLVGGTALFTADSPSLPFSPEIDAAIDAYTHQRGADRLARQMPPEEAWLVNSYNESVNRATQFQAQAAPLDLSGDNSFANQASQAAQYLSAGVARCVTLKFPLMFDSHDNNSSIQNESLGAAFTYLGVLNRALESTPGELAATLADETVVVVYSEMGRSPYINSANGKDHWMYTSCMMYGPGVRGNRQFGGYNDGLNGVPIDIASGEIDLNNGVPMTPDIIGSSLLTIAGLDPVEVLGADTTLGGLVA